MQKPSFPYSKTVYAISAILSIPLLIDICTACHLFPLWLAWIIFFAIVIVSIVRLVFALKQHCYKFAWGLMAQLMLGGGLLTFFQLSYNHVIETPVSHPVTPVVVNIAAPDIDKDTIRKTNSDHIHSRHEDILKHDVENKQKEDTSKNK